MSSLPFHLRDELKRSGKIFDLVRVFHFYIRVHNHQKSIRKEKKRIINRPTKKGWKESYLFIIVSVIEKRDVGFKMTTFNQKLFAFASLIYVRLEDQNEANNGKTERVIFRWQHARRASLLFTFCYRYVQRKIGEM